ncbi:MAG: TIGR03546 family protein [Gammaproteobacteria bacterium]|nr:TIGR03546 family protein [Gammaproteobacteria bacterium]
MFTQIIKFIRVLGSEASPFQISFAIGLAMIAGFTPLLSLHNVLVFFILLSFRVNLAAFMLTLGLFSGVAYLLDPMFHNIGLSLLQNPDLQANWTSMYNSLFWRIAHFNNTIVLGSLVVSLAAFIPVVLLGNVLIKQYRDKVMVYLQDSKIARFLQTSKIFTRVTSMMES